MAWGLPHLLGADQRQAHMLVTAHGAWHFRRTRRLLSLTLLPPFYPPLPPCAQVAQAPRRWS